MQIHTYNIVFTDIYYYYLNLKTIPFTHGRVLFSPANVVFPTVHNTTIIALGVSQLSMTL